MKYTVEITDAALEAIRAQTRYLAVVRQSPMNAARWLEQIWDAIDGLGQFPQRHGLAAEDAFASYEVRRVLVGNYLILFTVDEEAYKVWVVGFRHGGRLPRPEDLPPSAPTS